MSVQLMKPIEIRNSEVLDALNKFSWMYERRSDIERIMYRAGRGATLEQMTSTEALDAVREMGESHDGYPEKSAGYNLSAKQAMTNLDGSVEDYDLATEFFKLYGESTENIMLALNTRLNALCYLYPPGGYISWHNNANCPGYNLIFTWSETGDGSFSYWDTKEEKIVEIPDKKGWSCKGAYFGSYRDDPDKLVYHSAKTNCWRYTVSFVYDWTEMSTGIHDEIMEEIATDM